MLGAFSGERGWVLGVSSGEVSMGFGCASVGCFGGFFLCVCDFENDNN